MRIAQSALARALHAGRFVQLEQLDSPDEDGWVAARITFELKDEACGYLLGFGAEVEILEPQELREQVISLAQSLVAFYAQRAIVESSPD